MGGRYFHSRPCVLASVQSSRYSVLFNQTSYIPASVMEEYNLEAAMELPEGVTYVKDEEHQWSYGQVSGVTAEQMQRLKKVLVERKGAFAYSMKELVGYKGPQAEFQMVPNARAFHKPREYSPLETNIRDEKVWELYEANMIEECDTRSDFAACPTMPAKKDAEGNWTERPVGRRQICPHEFTGSLAPMYTSDPNAVLIQLPELRATAPAFIRLNLFRFR